jgi:hypothetical protein
VAERRISISWVLAGTLGVFGAYWLTVGAMVSANLTFAELPYVAHALGGVIAGALFVALAPLRPSREPLIAGVAAVGVAVAIFLLPDHPLYGWVAARSDHRWLTALGIAALSGGGAWAGAMARRRLAPSIAPMLPTIIVFAGVVTVGSISISGQLLMDFVHGPRVMYVFAVGTISALLGGFVAQTVIATYEPLACGIGVWSLIALMVLANPNQVQANKMGYALLGGAIFAAFAAWGAKLAWKRRVSLGTADRPDVPQARIEPG